MKNIGRDPNLSKILSSRPKSLFAKELKKTIKECTKFLSKNGVKELCYQNTLDFLQWWFLQKREKNNNYAAMNLSRKLRIILLGSDQFGYIVPAREKLLLKQTVYLIWSFLKGLMVFIRR